MMHVIHVQQHVWCSAISLKPKVCVQLGHLKMCRSVGADSSVVTANKTSDFAIMLNL